MLESLANRKIKRAVLMAPPRHSKTSLAGRAFPLWFHGRYPEQNLMYFTATDEMAKRAGKSARELAAQYLYPLFRKRLASTHGAWSHWKIDGSPPDRGEAMFSSIGGGRTMGAGADVIIVDDYFRNAEDALSDTRRKQQETWLLTSALSRLTPTGTCGLMATRWHRDDLIGVAERAQEITGERWEILRLPALCDSEDDPLGRAIGEALWRDMWPASKLDEIRSTYVRRGYGWIFDALYQQAPPLLLDAEWPDSYFPDSIWCDEFQRGVATVTALDPSKGQSDRSDYQAFVTASVQADGTVCVDASLDRWDITQLASRGADHVAAVRPDELVVEANAFQELLVTAFVQEFSARSLTIPLVGVTHTTNKMVRIRRLTSLLSAGKLRFVRSPGCALLVEQLRGFPNCKYDDGPDALEAACNRLDHILKYGLPDYYAAGDTIDATR